MKRLILTLLAVFTFAIYEKDPDMDGLDSDYLVYTNYDRKADFKQFGAYYIPGNVLVIGDKKDPEYWKSEAAAAIINAYKDSLNSKGSACVDNRDTADPGVQISYVWSTYHFTDYGRPGWWWNYPGYRDVPYWGDWGDWYCPYVVNYSITTNSLLTEIMSLKAPEDDNQKLPVLRSSLLSDPTNYPGKANQTLVAHAVNQPST